MKIEKVTYQKTYSIGPYLTDRVGFEASLDEPRREEDGSYTIFTPEGALSELEKFADAWHRKAHPHLYQEPNVLLQEIRNEPPPIQQIENREKAKGDIKASMEDCITLEQLKEYKLLASTDKDLQSIYMNRLKELTQ